MTRPAIPRYLLVEPGLFPVHPADTAGAFLHVPVYRRPRRILGSGKVEWGAGKDAADILGGGHANLL